MSVGDGVSGGVVGVAVVRLLGGWVVGVGGAAVGVLVGTGVAEGNVVAAGLPVGWGVSLGAHPASTPVAMILRKCRRDKGRFLGLFPQYVLFIAVFLSGSKIQRYGLAHRIPDLRETSNARQISCKLLSDVLFVGMLAIRAASGGIGRRRARGQADRAVRR